MEDYIFQHMNEQGGGAASQVGGTERRSVCLAKKRNEGEKERWWHRPGGALSAVWRTWAISHVLWES